MAELLQGLGFRRASWWSVAWLLSVIGFTTGAFLVAAHLLAVASGVPILVIHAVLWALWIVWLGEVFPRSRRAWLHSFGSRAFRPAFYLEILPGIGCSFAQIARPAFEGVVAGPRPGALGVAAGTVIAGVGASLIVLGVQKLGIAGTLFVREYQTLPPLLERDGIFRQIRHPLFVGGALLGLGAAMLVGGPLALALGAVNLLVIPVYVRMEDARCDQIFGTNYATYRQRVGGALPRPKGRRARLAPHVRADADLHRAAGGRGPRPG